MPSTGTQDTILLLEPSVKKCIIFQQDAESTIDRIEIIDQRLGLPESYRQTIRKRKQDLMKEKEKEKMEEEIVCNRW